MKYNNGVVVGRFQPFHIGHLEYVQEALDNCDFLYIAITTPGDKPTEYEPDNPGRYGKLNNPFTFEEREKMITLALKDQQIDLDHIQIVEFDPQKIDEWFSQVSKDAVYFLLHTDPDERKKEYEMRARGLHVVVLGEVSDREHAGFNVRNSMLKNEPWERYVTPSVAEFLKEIGAIQRLKGLSS